MFLLFVSFVAGVLTVLAPCVLPILPVIVGGSLASGSRRRAYTICLSLGASVIVFTLLLKASTAFIDVPQSFWDIFSGTILVLFGLVMLFPGLWDSLGFVSVLNRRSNEALSAGYRRNSVWGDMLMGASLGPVFSSCSPTYFVILATVLPASFAMGFADLLAYAIGLSGFLLVIALAGQTLVDKLGVTIKPGGWFRRSIGVLFLIVGLSVATGAAAQTEAWLLNRGFDVTTVEQQLLQSREAAVTPGAGMCTTTQCIAARAASSTAAEAQLYPKAPELAGIAGYINTGGKPITISQFKGKKVVLVDFWTYSCINCIRTIPYVESWYKKYKDQGLVVIGVSTPEFAFEHLQSNVENAVRMLGITYPVVLDNQYKTWNAFGNQFWPREYLIDINGYIVHDHAGEGDYAATEAAIRKALATRAQELGLAASSTKPVGTPSGAIAIKGNDVRSPETYFGSARNEYLANGTQGQAGEQTLTIPQHLQGNGLYLGGTWDFTDQYAQNTAAGAHISYLYNAKNVYLVAAPASGSVKLKVLLDGAPIPSALRGKDVDANGEVLVNQDRLYDLIKGSGYGIHRIDIEVESPGLQAYTFTFG